MGHLFVDVTSFMFGTSLKFRNERRSLVCMWRSFSLYKCTSSEKINNCKAGTSVRRIKLLCMLYVMSSLLLSSARGKVSKFISFVASHRLWSHRIATDTLAFSCLHIQVATFCHFPFPHTINNYAMPPPPFALSAQRNEKLKENDFLCYSIRLRILKHYLFCFREILYAFNDDGRRILDNNFLSSRSLTRPTQPRKRNLNAMGISWINFISEGWLERESETVGAGVVTLVFVWQPQANTRKMFNVYFHVISARVYIFSGGETTSSSLCIAQTLTSEMLFGWTKSNGKRLMVLFFPHSLHPIVNVKVLRAFSQTARRGKGD